MYIVRLFSMLNMTQFFFFGVSFEVLKGLALNVTSLISSVLTSTSCTIILFSIQKHKGLSGYKSQCPRMLAEKDLHAGSASPHR